MGPLWPKSASFEFDANGDPALGALAYFYDADTSTPRATYQDAALSTTHEHPVEADGNGRWPAVFLQFGSYKQRLTTAGGTEISTIDEIPNPEPFDSSFTLDTTTILNTGDIWCALKNGTRTGAVRLNGRTLGSAASSATERANADTSDLYAYIWNNTANGQCPVATGRGATAVADFAANKAITLPDWRAVAPIGFDDMGNTAASLLGSAPVVTGSGILAGSILGANTHTLLTAEIPTHTHSFSATTSADGVHAHDGTTQNAGVDHTHAFTTGIQSVGHTHTVAPGTPPFTTGQFVGNITANNGWSGTPGTATTSTESANHTHSGTTGGASAFSHQHTFTTDVNSTHTHTVSGTTGTGSGSGSAHNNLSRAAPVTWFIKL